MNLSPVQSLQKQGHRYENRQVENPISSRVITAAKADMTLSSPGKINNKSSEIPGAHLCIIPVSS